MANEYGFFASKNHDRRYSADDFSSFFGDFFTDGVLGKDSSSLMVRADKDMKISINSGTAYIKGHWYRTSSEKTLEISDSDTAYDRIDAIAIRCDYEKRMVYPAVIEGIAAETPSEPQLTRNERYHDIVLAYIYVTANCVKLTQSDITDKRGFDDVCGFVTSAVDHISTADLFAQYDAQWELLKGACKNDADKVISAWDSLIAVKTINKTSPVNGNIDLTQGDIPSGKNAFQMTYYVQSGTITMPSTTSSPSYKGVTMTFPVAFKSTPTLLLSVKDTGYDSTYRTVSAAFDNLSKTDAHIRAWATNASSVATSSPYIVHWVAFGEI